MKVLELLQVPNKILPGSGRAFFLNPVHMLHGHGTTKTHVHATSVCINPGNWGSVAVKETPGHDCRVEDLCFPK
jgi:hypothetical protein